MHDSSTLILPAPSTRLWLGFSAMCLGLFMAVLDIQIVATSLPDIQTGLGMRPEDMSWIQTAYLIAEVISISLTGWLTRLLGLRTLCLAAIAGFTLTSLGCAFSTGLASLIACRIVQGLTGGCLIPLVFSAVFLIFPFRLQGLATTIAGTLAVFAPTIGPLVGGWITDTYSWHWLFLINLAPGVLVLAVVMTCLPGRIGVEQPLQKLDWIALALIAATLASLEIGLKRAPDHGWLSLQPIMLFLIVISCGSLFIFRTWLAENRIVDLRLLADRRFSIGCALSFILGFGLYGSVYLMPVFLSLVRLHSAFEIGQIMLVSGVAQLLVAPVAVALERRFDARLLSSIGFAIFAVGLGFSYYATWETDFAGMFWPQVIRGGAIMFCLLPPTRLALNHLPASRVPDASALFNLLRNLGGAIGLALIDTVIWGRTPIHVQHFVSRLLAGDANAARLVGLPTDRFVGKPIAAPDEATQELVRPLVERAGLVAAINDAWMMLGLLTLIGVVLALFLLKRKPASSGN
ncbi:DHA2 family efflux MFS transporter permease subunit [Dongia soli]|uniref:DHA2 family efflux MFS transporter permease subunit n=1 Tax=Dongia soli TaxID=600628 RepID=A0ABU5E5A2_9PROT|nr:DHA2 family efflux MFS transporter permease subunit [Dongia soli]MDY0881445.1 DHA2 family efflux MFS transporter permease subunit [Dongia soli]